MPDRNWKAFESPNKEFDENGDDDSKDLDNNFDIADPKPEANTKEGWGFDDDEDEYDGSNDKFVPKDYVLDYINSQGANGAHNDEIKKSYFPEFEPERISHTTMYQIDGLYDLQQAGIIRREGDRWYSNESYKQDQIVDKNPMYSYDGKKREGVYDANKDRKGANEGTTYKHQSGLVNGTESYETVDVDFGGLDSAVEFTGNCGVRVTEENLPKHMAEAHGSKLTEARYKTYKTQHNIGINESDANVNDIGLGKKTRSGESLAKEDWGFGLHPSTNGQDNFDSAFGVSSPEEEQQMEDQIDDAMNPIESEYFDIKSEYWESFIDDPVKFDEFIDRVQRLRSEAEQAVATIPRRKTGFYTRRNFDEVEWLNSVIDDMNGIVRQAEPMRNNEVFDKLPSGNIGESLLRAKEEAFPLMDFQSIDAKIEELERALEDPTLDNAHREELEQRLIKVTQARTDLESGAYTPDLMGSGVNPNLGIYEAKKVWKSYEMQDEYAYEKTKEEEEDEQDDLELELEAEWDEDPEAFDKKYGLKEADDEDVKVSLNIQDGTLTDKPVERTDEHHTVSDSESTSPDDEGFSVGDIASGNYEKVIGYNDSPNHELGDHKLKSKKGERNSQDNPASETQTFYSNIIGKLSGLESDE